jgi:hypothetical protein
VDLALRPRTLRVPVLGLLGATLLTCAAGVGRNNAGGAESQAPDGCVRVPLDPHPTWAFDGGWLPEGGALVLTDVGAGILRLYDRAGQSLRTVARPGHGPLEFNRPSKIWPISGGFLLGNGSRYLWLDEELTPIRSYDLETVPVAPSGTVRALFDWAASEDRIFTAGDVLLPNGSWKRGLLSMPVSDATIYHMVREIPVSSRQEFDHYLMGYQLVAALGGQGYFLTFSDPPAILEIDSANSVRILSSFPGGFETLPALPLHGGFASAEIRYRAYESARLPVGLYGWGGRLYVLTRAPASASGPPGTRWSLTKIDPRTDRIVGSVVLPTRAAHLSLVPGPESWAVLEKGRVERYGVQPIPSLLLIPAAWIEGESTPLGSAEPKEGLCEGL